jgi:NADH dehydrogenase
MSTILVTGASGFVGSHTVPALLQAGHRVAALVRTEAGGETVRDRLPPDRRDGITIRIGDVTQPDTLAPALVGVDAVIHLAGIPRDVRAGADLRLVNTEGTRALVVAMQAAGVRRLVHMGAMGVDDDPALHYASSKAKAEALVRASPLDWTILKPSLQFGAGDGFFNIVADLVRLSPGLVPVPGRGLSQFQPIHAGDVARVAVACLADADTIRGVFELGGPRYWTYGEITGEVLTALGKRRVIIPMPVLLIGLVARSAEFVRLPFPVASDQLRQLRLDNIGALDVVPARFGFEPRSMAGRLGYLRASRPDQLEAEQAMDRETGDRAA